MPTGTHDLVAKDGSAVRKGRISPELRTAITLIVHEGLTVADAAKRTGYQTESLSKALIKPHVKAFRADVKRAWLLSKTERAWLTAADIAENSPSDAERLKAAKIFIDMDLDAMKGSPERASQLVQIITNTVNMNAQLPDGQMRGIIEAKPWSPPTAIASNSHAVGHDDDDPSEAP